MLLWNKWRCSYLPNVIVALQPLKRKFCWVLWSFLISSVIENLNSVSLQKTADLFPEHEPQGSFRLFFNAESFFCNAENTLLLLLRIQRYMWWITTPHVGILRTMWGLQSKNFGEPKGQAKKTTPAIYSFHSDKVLLLNMHWSWDTTQYVRNLVVAFSND